MERALRKQDIARSKPQEHMALADVALRFEYVGNTPSEPGTYLVVDSYTGALYYTRISMAVRLGELIVRYAGVDAAMCKLSVFNHAEFRWFRVPAFDPADMVAIRKLPIA